MFVYPRTLRLIMLMTMLLLLIISFFPDALKAFWREAQHCPHIPTCVLRGVLEHHTTPESLEMICNLLSKQSGSVLHDSQVHVYDAVGHPVYVKNRNARILKNTDMGGAIQRSECLFQCGSIIAREYQTSYFAFLHHILGSTSLESIVRGSRVCENDT